MSRTRRGEAARTLRQLVYICGCSEARAQVGARLFGGEKLVARADRNAKRGGALGNLGVRRRKPDPHVQATSGHARQCPLGDLAREGPDERGAARAERGTERADVSLPRWSAEQLHGRLLQRARDVGAIGCDLLSATCRKFLRGPRGSGFLYVADRVLRAGYEPQFIDMHGARWIEPQRYVPVETAARFEEWEFPYATVLGCAEAARCALRVGLDAIAPRATRLAARLREGLAALPGVRVLDRGPDPAALVTFDVAGWEAQPFKRAMDARRINSALSFHDFAQYDFTDKQVDWCLRLSPHYYNTEAEVDAAVDAVSEWVRRGPRG
ncbi:MAG TPA: aminotransferase class V-fold PLP-dependent enzyme [Gemmatimonadaceae bacterium]